MPSSSSSVEASLSLWRSVVESKTLTEAEVKQFYASWSKRYDDDLSILKTRTQRRLAERLAALVGVDDDDGDVRTEDVRVLDLACGTGLVGVHLRSLGFQHIDGVDMSRAMLDILERREGVYSAVTCCLVGNGARIRGVADRTYDAVVISGGFARAHLPVDTLHEVCRVLKPGGYFLNGMALRDLHSVEALRQLEPTMAAMAESGEWTSISRDVEPGDLATTGREGVFHTFRKN